MCVYFCWTRHTKAKKHQAQKNSQSDNQHKSKRNIVEYFFLRLLRLCRFYCLFCALLYTVRCFYESGWHGKFYIEKCNYHQNDDDHCHHHHWANIIWSCCVRWWFECVVVQLNSKIGKYWQSAVCMWRKYCTVFILYSLGNDVVLGRLL